MGDRAIVCTRSHGQYGPAATYLHWGGYAILDQILKAGATGRLRQGDLGYATARLVGELHLATLDEAPLGLGLIAPPTAYPPPATYSHGDAGVVVLDVDAGTVTLHDGYLEKRLGRGPHLLSDAVRRLHGEDGTS